MNKPYLHFAHANGFPAPVYRKLLDKLGERYQVGYLETMAHDRRFPVTDGWPHLADETIAYIESSYDAPVIGVGHSLGGLVLFFAAIKRPDLFRALVILDSPMFNPWRSRGLRLAKLFGLMDRVTPAGTTKRRRNGWSSVEEVRDYFAGKGLFTDFDPDCLEDYARFGTVVQQGKVRLKFSPEIECNIFRSLPHHYYRYKGRLKVPTAFIAGTDSKVVNGADLSYLSRHFRVPVLHQKGGHLYPLEAPLATAEAIHAIIGRLGERASKKRN